jgi:hypothetical protein
MVSATQRRLRVGLVLGAGGVLGAAWMAGALAALQQRLPYPLGALDLIVGTGAGSVMATALRCGVGVGDIVEHQRGSPRPAIGANLLDPDAASGCWRRRCAPGCRAGDAEVPPALVAMTPLELPSPQIGDMPPPGGLRCSERK